MTTDTTPETIPGLEALQPQPRLRPFQYILLSQIIDFDDDDFDGGERPWHLYVEPYSTREGAIGDAGQDDGLWDNWRGVWVIEPYWADEIEITADGPARLDVRVGCDPLAEEGS